jgi:ribosomal protein S1
MIKNEKVITVVPEGFTEKRHIKNTIELNPAQDIYVGDIYDVKVVSASEKGVMVEFQSGLKEVMEADELLVDYEIERIQPHYFNGKQIYVKVVDKKDEGLIISRKAALQDNKEKLKNELKIGDIVVARVTGFSPTVALLDLGGYQGVLTITEYSWGFFHSFNNIGRNSGISVGNFLDLMVKDFQVNREGIEQVVLSRKQVYPNPWPKLEKILSPDPDIAVRISNGTWKADRAALKLEYKRARTDAEKREVSKKINSFDFKLPRVEGTYLGAIETDKENSRGGSVFVEIYKDPDSGDSITGRALYPRMEIQPGEKVQYMVTEFNARNKTIFGVIKALRNSN